jgi:hypothetical protein
MLYDLIDSENNVLVQAFKLRPTTPPLLPGQQWVPTGYVPPPVSTVPHVVSRFQGCSALMQAGYLDDVEAYMTSGDPFEQLAWKTITEMHRNSPMTEKLGQLLGLDEMMIDDLFRFAATISA